MKESVISFSRFVELTSATHGGAISITTSTISLSITCTSFEKCSATGDMYGGGVYIVTELPVKFKSIYGNDCSAYVGYAIYVSGSASNIVLTEINRTVIDACHGKDHADCSFWYSNLIARDYNGTESSSTNAWTSFYIWFPRFMSEAFFNYYKNNNAILCGAETSYSDNYISYSNFIENTANKNNGGLIWVSTSRGSTAGSITIDHICAFNNPHRLIYASIGKIIVSSLECDVYSGDASSSGQIEKLNVKEGLSNTLQPPRLDIQNCIIQQALCTHCRVNSKIAKSILAFLIFLTQS